MGELVIQQLNLMAPKGNKLRGIYPPYFAGLRAQAKGKDCLPWLPITFQSLKYRYSQ